MSTGEVGLQIDICLEPDAEAVELDDAALQLREELLQTDARSVERPPGEPPPPGTRAVEAALLGSLLVHVGRETLGGVIRAIEGWLSRRESGTVKVTLDGDSIELTNVTDTDRERLIESFLTRHGST